MRLLAVLSLMALGGVAMAEETAAILAKTSDELALRFGVLADVHIDQRHFDEPSGGRSVEVFRTALRCLGARSVDGVVIAGAGGVLRGQFV